MVKKVTLVLKVILVLEPRVRKEIMDFKDLKVNQAIKVLEATMVLV